MDELTITITVEDWRSVSIGNREDALRSLGDHLLTLACRKADELGLSIHAEHDLEY